tara:strand:+ start:327 stop:749 length:423 start_codon:yes stop_codon:yes gene_type:complete
MKKYSLEIDGKKYEVEVDLSGPNPSVLVNGKKIDVTIDNSNNLEKPKISRKQTKKTAEEKNDAAVESTNDPGDLKALMPGKVTKVLVSSGQNVKVGEPVLLMESMKMEQTIVATIDGSVSEILVSEGDTVEVGKIMIKIN